jgi:hypothetical protein
MNDQFMYDFRPSIRQKFAKDLFMRIERQQGARFSFQTMLQTISPRKLVYFFMAVLIAGFVMLYSISGSVRAEVDLVVRTIAGFLVEERTTSPIEENIPLNSITEDEISTAEAQPVFTPYKVEIPSKSISTIMANPPFEFVLPSYLPPGFTMEKDFSASTDYWVSVNYTNELGSEIQLLVEKTYTGYLLPVGVDSVEEVKVNGQAAMLVRGGWTAEHTWQQDYGMELHWQVNGRYYRLIWKQRTLDRNEIMAIGSDLKMVQEELIHMAESIK